MTTRDEALRAVCEELLNYAENYELEHIEWARHARRWAAQIESYRQSALEAYRSSLEARGK